MGFVCALLLLPKLSDNTLWENALRRQAIERDYSIAADEIPQFQGPGPAVKPFRDSFQGLDLRDQKNVVCMAFRSAWHPKDDRFVSIDGNGVITTVINEDTRLLKVERSTVEKLLIDLVDSGFLGINGPLLMLKHELCLGESNPYRGTIDGGFDLLCIDLQAAVGFSHSVSIQNLRGMLKGAEQIPEYHKFSECIGLVEAVVAQAEEL